MWRLLAVMAGIVLAVAGWNAIIIAPTLTTTAFDKKTDLRVYRRWGLSPDEIVIDVQEVRGSMLDVTKSVQLIAEDLSHQRFQSIVLACRGRERLLMDGDFFARLGRDYRHIRAFRLAPHVRRLDGAKPFPASQAAEPLLAELEDLERHNAMHVEWWGGPKVETCGRG